MAAIALSQSADLARIMKYCITQSPQKDEFLKITQTMQRTFQDTTKKKQYTCNNHNAFLNMMEGALTGKTGFTAKAGYCYVGAVRQGDRTFVVALLACGWPNNKSYKWADMKKLVQYGLDQYDYRQYWREAMTNDQVRLLEAGKEKEVKNSAPKNGDLFTNGAVTAFLNVSAKDLEKRILMKKTETIEIRIQEEKMLQAPVKKKDSLGKVTLFLNGQQLDQKSIVSGETIERKNLIWTYRQIWKSYLFNMKKQNNA